MKLAYSTTRKLSNKISSFANYNILSRSFHHQNLLTTVKKDKLNLPISLLMRTQIFSFSKKAEVKSHGKKQQHKAKDQEEKNKINEEYNDTSTEDLISSYKTKADEITKHEQEDLGKIMSLRVSTKLFETVTVILKHEKSTIADLSTISMKGSNIINIAPYDQGNKEQIVQALQSTNLDLQINSEGTLIHVIVGPIPKELKLEVTNKIKRVENNFKENIKKLRHAAVNETKKLEKIIGKDTAKNLEKQILDVIDKSSKQLEKQIKAKLDEVNSIK
jgi:ribosome recycling factor